MQLVFSKFHTKMKKEKKKGEKTEMEQSQINLQC